MSRKHRTGLLTDRPGAAVARILRQIVNTELPPPPIMDDHQDQHGQRKIRLDKLARLKELGVNPYPDSF